MKYIKLPNGDRMLDARPTKLRVVARQLLSIFPDARITVEDYPASQWLNIFVAGRTFTAEARRNEGASFIAGFSEIKDSGDFGNHDEFYPYRNPQNLSTCIAESIMHKIGRSVEIPEIAVSQKAQSRRRLVVVSKLAGK